MIRILVVDDNRHFRERLKTFLAAFPEVEIVGEAGDGHEALSKAKELKPDVALVDMKMGSLTGLSVTSQLKKELPDIQVIIVSRYDMKAYQEAAQAAGASAYVAKKDLIANLLPAIRQAVQTTQTLNTQLSKGGKSEKR